MKIGIDARMFSDSFTGIGRYNFELTKRFFLPHEILQIRNFAEGEIISRGKPPQSPLQKGTQEIEWVIFMNEPEFSKFTFPPHVRKVLVNAPHYSFAEQVKFLRLLHREKCDLVHFTHFNLPIFYRGAFVVTIHDTTISFFPGKKMNSWWQRLAYRIVIRHAVHAAKRVITVSQNTSQDVQKLFGVPASKISVVPNGIGSEFRPDSDAEKQAVKKKFSLGEKFLLYTGNWREHKNLVGLLKAFAKIIHSGTAMAPSRLQGANMDSHLQKNVPENSNSPESEEKKNSSVTPKTFSELRGETRLQLVITGRPDPHYPEVQETISKLGLHDSVKLLGLVDFSDLVRLYGAASVYTFPSLYEGFGLPPLEAMSCGTPVAASRVSAIPEVCGEGALYFDPRDIDDMAKKILQLLTDDSLRQNLIANGKKQIQQFSWDTAAAETLKILRSVVH